MGNVARENAALSISNAAIDVYQHTVLENWDGVASALSSAQGYFDAFLMQPALFLLYSVVSSHILTNKADKVVSAQWRKLLAGFQHSSHKRLGQFHPLSQVLTQLILDADSPSNTITEWSIAILDCLAHTRDHLPSEAARFTSLKMKHGLAWILQIKAYPFSAISVLEDIISETLTFTHPVLGKTSYLRWQLAGIYHREGFSSQARGVLNEAFALANGIFDEGLLYCSALLGQIQESSGQIIDAERTYRSLYEEAHQLQSSSTIQYARDYCAFLRRHSLEVAPDVRFREQLLAADAMDASKLQKRKLDMYAKYVTLEDAGYS